MCGNLVIHPEKNRVAVFVKPEAKEIVPKCLSSFILPINERRKTALVSATPLSSVAVFTMNKYGM